MTTRAERDARLDELQKATEAWSKDRTERLTKQAERLQKILDGRGFVHVVQAGQAATAAALITEIDDFLVTR